MIACWFSCGAASAVATKKTIERFPNKEIRIVYSPIIEEHEDNLRFLKDCEKWFGKKIELALNPKFPNASAVEVWEKRQYMSGIHGAPCTVELKKEARYEWERINNPEWHVLGFTLDEIKRHERFILTERENVIPVLIDAKLTKEDCLRIIKDAGINPPKVYSLGFPNANCIGCVKATSSTYWDLVRKKFPDIFKQRAEQSRGIGARLVRHKGKRMFLDELPEKTFGRKLKNLMIDCGIFCEEK